MRWKIIAGILLVVIQLVVLIYYRHSDERYFCWAPFDQQAVFDLTVEIDGRELSQKEIGKRYHIHTGRYYVDGKVEQHFTQSRYIGNVQGIIKQYELTYGKTDNAKINMTYTLNGGEENHWSWPANQ